MLGTSNSPKSRKNAKKFRNRKPRNRVGVLSLQPSYDGQVCVQMKIPSFTASLSTTVGTGAIANVTTIGSAIVTNWATRFQSLYEEFRIISCTAKVDCFSSNNPGQIRCYWDEKSATAPTAATASTRGQFVFSASDVTKRHSSTWMARDLLDLQYSPVATNPAPVYFKLYTDNASYGSSIVATGYVSVSFMMVVQFRGYAN